MAAERPGMAAGWPAITARDVCGSALHQNGRGSRVVMQAFRVLMQDKPIVLLLHGIPSVSTALFVSW
jgi:hypothetical protein